MKMIAPIEVTEAVLVASNISEDDYPAWVSGTTYAKGDRVIVASVHKVYESAQGPNQGNAPATDDGSNWLEVGSTNLWKAFDRKIGQAARRGGKITYTLDLPGICTGVGFLGLSAGSVRVQVSDGTTTIYDETQQLVDSTEIVNYFTYYTYVPEYSPKAIFVDVPGYTGYQMTITVDAGVGTAEVGEVVVGRFYELGITQEGTEVGFEDLSRKERDAWGNIEVVPRPSYDTVDFQIAMHVGSEERVSRILNRYRATAALYFASESQLKRGTIVYGFPKGFRPKLAVAGLSRANLRIEGLV